MNQKSFQAITAMLNAFPSSGANIKALLSTYDQMLTGVSDRAVEESALRFISGEVEGQSKSFAPSTAQFKEEALRRQEYHRLAAHPRIPSPQRQERLIPADEQARMRLKMPMFKHAFPNQSMIDELARANASGMEAMIILAGKWGIPVPPELYRQTEDDWRLGRNRALADMERNPPPFMRHGRKRHDEAA